MTEIFIAVGTALAVLIAVGALVLVALGVYGFIHLWLEDK